MVEHALTQSVLPVTLGKERRDDSGNVRSRWMAARTVTAAVDAARDLTSLLDLVAAAARAPDLVVCAERCSSITRRGGGA